MSSAEGLFSAVARLQEGSSTPGATVDAGCREAGELASSLKQQEEQAETLLAKMRDGQARLVEVRASVAATEAEVASLLPAGARAPVLAEDLWCRPLREEAWGAAGIGALEWNDEPAGRAMGMVAGAYSPPLLNST